MTYDKRRRYVITEVHKSSNHYDTKGSSLIGERIKILNEKESKYGKDWVALNFSLVSKDFFEHYCWALKIQ